MGVCFNVNIYICVSQCLLEGEGIRKEFWILRWWVRMVPVNTHMKSSWRTESEAHFKFFFFSLLCVVLTFFFVLAFIVFVIFSIFCSLLFVFAIAVVLYFIFLFFIRYFFYSFVLLSFFSWLFVYLFPSRFLFFSLCIPFFSSFLFSSSCFKLASRAKFEMEWYHPYLPLMIFFSHVVEDSQIPFSLPERRGKKKPCRKRISRQ